jgi:uncharacterized repeat protein (TIGR03803 family)
LTAETQSIESDSVLNRAGYPGAVEPAQGRDGKLYGTYSDFESGICGGGAFRAAAGVGAMTPYNFSGSLACSGPFAGLTLGTNGNFYGTTTFGGTSGDGTLFEMTPGGRLTILHNFANQGDGGGPNAAPIIGSDGNLYGTTAGVGDIVDDDITGSVVYKYDLSSGILTTLYEFGKGQYTYAPLIQGKDGNLYVTTPTSSEYGSILKITTSGVLLDTYNFAGSAGGAGPWAPLMQASDGNFYGTTQQDCGQCGYFGTIYRMTEAGVITTIHSFNENSGGNYPQSGLTEGTDGYLYGATWGNDDSNRVVYRISKGGHYAVLYAPTDGSLYNAELLQHTDGIFYGTSVYGGTYGAGTLFSLNMGLSPFVAFVQPTSGVGGTAQILGQGLTGTTAVTFNGVAATKFTVVSDTYMTAVVPSGATTGAVVVTTPGGALTSNVSFRIID